MVIVRIKPKPEMVVSIQVVVYLKCLCKMHKLDSFLDYDWLSCTLLFSTLIITFIPSKARHLLR